VGALLKDGIVPGIRLEAFAPNEVAALAEAALGPAVADADLVAWLFDRARGNALFTTALLEDLAADPSRRVVPVSVQERVRQMRAGFGEQARRALDIAAVLGRSFSLRTIAPLLGPQASRPLDPLVADRLLVQRPDGYDFAHPLLREAVYEDLGPARRRELHQAAAGEFEAAEELHPRALALAPDTGDPGQIGWNAAVASLTELYRGRFDRAAAVLDPAVDPEPLAADIGPPWRTLTDWFLGRWQLGRRDCQAVRQMFPIAPSAHMAWAFSMVALFEAVLAPSAPPRGPGPWEPLVRQAARTYGDRDLYFFTALHRWAAGWLSGELEAAEGELAGSAAWLRRTGAIGFEGLLLAERPEVLVGLGEVGEAEREAERAEEVAGLLGTPFSAAQAAFVAGVVAEARGRSLEAASAFGAAAQGAGAAPAPFLRARCLEHLARVAPADRVRNLRAAAALYDSLPAPWLRDRALAELRSLGPEGRRAAQRVGALTGREREVATLAARGLPTTEIAARLHVSRRTVESHLDRIYRKLGIDGRRRLAEALDQR